MNDVIDPECALACSYAPAGQRAALTLLWRLDAALGRIVATAREPALAAIKLTWWRDALVALDIAPPPVEPLLREIAAVLLPAGISGTALAGIEHGWTGILTAPDDQAAALHAKARGARIFTLAAAILGGAAGARADAAGEGWALVDLARRRGGGCMATELGDARALLDRALARRWPRHLRPIGMLAALARADARRASRAPRRQGSPLRMLRMLAHRLTGY